MKTNRRKRMERLIMYCLIALVLVIYLLPFLNLVLTSFKLPKDQRVVSLIFQPTLENYFDAFFVRAGLKNYLNSLVVGLLSMLLSLAIGSSAGYALSRFDLRIGNALLVLILALRMVPPLVAAIPLYVIMRNLGLLDTHLALILLHSTFQVPFTVWLMRGFFADIPRDVEEAAMVDGCSTLGVLTRISLPLVAPGLTVTAVFIFLFSFNEFLYSLLFSGTTAKTMPVTVAGYITGRQILWGQMAAGGVALVIPALVIISLFQQYLVRGFTFGLIKE